jgi:hypothetical protein
VGAVEEDFTALDAEQLEASGPRRAPVAASPRVGGDHRDPGFFERVEDGVRDRGVVGLMPAPERDAGRSERCELHVDPIAVPAEELRRAHLHERGAHASCPAADGVQRLAARARDGTIAALDDRRLLARDRRDRVAEPGHVVECHVRDGGDAAVPGVRRVEAPAQPHLHERDLDPLLGEPAEEHRGQELELGRGPMAPLDPFRDLEDLVHQPGERHRIDRSPVDLQPLAIRHEVRLGRRADTEPGRTQGAAGNGEHAALAVRAADEGTAQRALRVTELAKERPCSTKAQPDAEPTPRGQGADGGVVGLAGRSWPGQRPLSSSS